MRDLIRAIGIFSFFFLYHLAAAYAATEHLPEGYFYQRADVTGDGRDEMIAQPPHAGDEAYILFATGADSWEGVWQRLNDIDPRLAWDNETAAIIAGDYNGDGRDDLYVQGRAAGSTQAILLANEGGSFDQVHHIFQGQQLGFEWHGDARELVAGDFNGNGRDELLLQGRTGADVHQILHTNNAAAFAATGVAWVEGHLGLRWHTGAAELYSGDLNGDGRDDMLWRRRAGVSPGGGEPAVAMLLANAQGEFDEISQQWEKDFLGAEWDPATHRIELRDINGDGIADIILIALAENGTHYLVPGRLDGQLSEVAMRWQGAQSAEAAWASQNPGRADIVVNPGRIEAQTAELTKQSLPTQQSSSDSSRFDHEVGTLPGEFSVDPTGAANYRIPIEVPPGVGGMQPDLAFLYSSRAGNGLLGQGWSLSGLSAITRCPKTIAQTGSAFVPVTYTNNDAFCLDGQLLLAATGTSAYGAPGTVYGTEISSFQRIESRGGSNSTDRDLYTGPDHFVVKDKAGLIREYGNTEDSNIKLAGGRVTKQWSLNRIRDRFGNYIDFTYEHGTYATTNGNLHAYWPSEISWHNRHDALIGKIELEYQERDDIVAGYEARRPDILFGDVPSARNANHRGNSLFKRLETVRVYARNSFVRSYSIEYTAIAPSLTSAISKITMCNAGGECLPPTEFSWSDSEEGFESEPINLVDHRYETTYNFSNFRTGDVNGDGRMDVIHFASDDFNWINLENGLSFNTGVSLDGYDLEKVVTLDYNRDGRTDLLLRGLRLVGDFEVEYYWSIVVSQSGGTYSMLPTEIQARGYSSGMSPVPVDIDNDGFPEILFVDDGKLKFHRNLGKQGFETTATIISGVDLAGGHQLIPIEFNGDGRMDVLVTYSEGRGGDVLVSNGSTLKPADFFPTEHAVPLDVNADGLTDLLMKGHPMLPETSDNYWYTYLNIGGVFHKANPMPMAPAYSYEHEDYRKAQALDFNRDGRSDLLVPGADYWRLFSYDQIGKGWTTESTNLPVGDGISAIIPVDYDGNNVGDLLFKDGVWKLLPGRGEPSGLLKHVSNGLGDEQAVYYWSLARGGNGDGVYLGNDDPLDARTQELVDTGRARFASPPLMVVASIEADTGTAVDGVERRVVTSYRYGTGVLDLTGRGFLGFRKLHVYNANTGIETVNLHQQAFPFTGMVSEARRHSGSTTLTSVTETYDDGWCTDTNGEELPRSRCAVKKSYVTQFAGLELGPLISETFSAFGMKTAAETADGGTFPYIASTSEIQYRYPADDPHSRVKVTETSYEYGATKDGKVTGDPTLIVVKTTSDGESDDEHVVTTANQYAENDLSRHWCLGRLTRSDVTHRRVNYLSENQAATTGTRTATFSYDQLIRAGDEKSCRLQVEASNVGTSQEVTKSHQFDEFGNVVSTSLVDAAGSGRTVAKAYDYYGLFPRMTENALGHQEHYEWNHRFGVKRTSTGPNGLKTSWKYDDFGRLIEEGAPRENVRTSYLYEWCEGNCVSDSAVYRKVISSTTGSGVSITEYDALQREVARRSTDMHGRLVTSETVFDSLGRAYLVSFPYVSKAERCWKHTVFDLLGRPLVTSEPANGDACARDVIGEEQATPLYDKKSTYSYDGSTTTVTGPDGRTRKTVVNVVGRTRYVEEDGRADLVTRFDYDAFGNTTTVKTSDGSVVHIEYDAAGNKIRMTDPDMGTWSYGYTGFGELEWQEDAKGNRVEMQYDALGRMVSRTDTPTVGAPQTTEWVYDAGHGARIGKLALVVQSDGYTESYSYNEYGEPTETVRFVDGQMFQTTRTYDEFGRPDLVVYPDAATLELGTGEPATETLEVPEHSNGDVAISWSRNNGHALYKLYRNTIADSAGAGLVYTGPLGSFTDTLPADGRYYYWLQVCNAAGCGDDLIGPGQTIAELPPQAPAWLVFDDVDHDNDGSVPLTWAASEGATSYRISKAPEFDGDYAEVMEVAAIEPGNMIPITSTIDGLSDGTYHLAVSACKDDICSRPTKGMNALSVSRHPPSVGMPSISPAVTNDSTTTVSWTDVDDPAVNYYLVETLNFNGEVVAAREVGPSGTGTVQELIDDLRPPEDGGIDRYNSYRFRVKACKRNNGNPLCSTSPFSEWLKSGNRPLPPTAIHNPAVETTRNFEVGFEDAYKAKPENYEVEEARDEHFTEDLRSITDLEQECVENNEGGKEIFDCDHSHANVENARNGLHWYRARICSAQFGCSDWAESGSPTDIRTHPGEPRNVTTAPTWSDNGSYTIAWDAPTGQVTHYEVYEAQGLGVGGYSRIANVTTTNYSVSGKPTDTFWRYQIKACYVSGGTFCSEPVSAPGVNVLLPPGRPGSLSIPSSSSTGNYTVSWGAASGVVARYELQEATNDNFTSARTLEATRECIEYWEPEAVPRNPCKTWDTEQHIDFLNRGSGTYYYRVRACNDSDCGEWRDGANPISVRRPPGMPSYIDAPAESTNGAFTVSWGTASGTVTKYQLYEKFGSNSWQLVYSGTSRSRYFSNKGEGAFNYRVRACNGSSCSGYRYATVEVIDYRGGGGGGGGGCRLPPCTDPLSEPADPIPLYEGAEPETSIEPVDEPSAAEEMPVADVRGVEDATDAMAARAAKARNSDEFRAMPPVRPVDFYRELKRGPRESRPVALADIGEAGIPNDATADASAEVPPSRRSPTQQKKFPSSLSAKARPVKTASPATNSSVAGTTSLASALPAASLATASTGYRHAVRHVYHSVTGALERIHECDDLSDTACDGQVYWQLDEVNLSGAATLVTLGNGLQTRRNIDHVTGLVKDIWTEAGSTRVQDLHYEWDVAGNLTLRTDARFAGGITEEFGYDSLYRLKRVTRTYATQGSMPDAGEFHNHYAANGNILCLNVTDSSGCGTNAYSYDADEHPHAVRNTPGSATPYTYDPNGSMTSGPGGRNITWSAFNKPLRIANNSTWSEFTYDPNRARYKQTTPGATTYYVGALYERVIERDSDGNPTGHVTHRHHIFAGGEAVAVYTCTTSCGNDPQGNTVDGTRDETWYLHRDHLGSVNAVTTGHGLDVPYGTPVVVDRFYYTAWGEMRRWSEALSQLETVIAQAAPLTRGYTGHEMLNELGLIHMNGRIYDPKIGRFLSADPFVQFPHSTQGYNRYTYVGNNPLTFTDPSGYFLKKLFRGAVFSDIKQIAPTLIGIAMCAGTAGVGCAAAAGALSGAIGGYLATGSLEGALTGAALGAISGAAFAGIGGSDWGVFGKAIASGLAGGALSVAGGGRFGDGFLGGIAGSFAGQIAPTGDIATDMIVGAVVGGSVAAIGGGKFANGAISGAMAAAIGNSSLKRRDLNEDYVSIGNVEDIDATEGQARFEKVKELLVSNDVPDVENVKFVNKYAARTASDRIVTFDNYSDYEAFITDGKGSWYGGSARGNEATVYRNAVASEVLAYRNNAMTTRAAWTSINASAGVHGGIFIIGHELGHFGTASYVPTLTAEIEANRYGGNLLRQVRGW